MNTDIVTLNGGVATDDRGCVKFVNDFNFSGVKRFYQVENHKAGFIRAWHGHKKEGKYIYVARGSAIIGAVKLSSNKDPERFVLSSNKPQILFIPEGYANGAMTLEKDTIIQYFSTSTLEESADDDYRFDAYKWDIWNIEYR